jgi:type IV secretion system protein VirB9
MKIFKLTTIALAISCAALTLTGCATGNTQTFSPASQIVTKEVPVPVAPEAVVASYGYGNDPALVEAYKKYQKTGKAPNVYTDGFVSFPYAFNTQPIISCQPLRVCSIELQQGENITGLQVGDSANWIVGKLYTGTQPNGAWLITFKPAIDGLSTNMIITTDKQHTYNISLVSDDNAYVRQATFYYPLETDAAIADAASQANSQNAAVQQSVISTSTNINLNSVHFNYDISGDHPSWRPTRVFDDGTHTLIEFPESVSSGDLPLLFILNDGDKQLVNYRKQGNYYVVDRLFQKAVLISGVGWSQVKVTITNEND